MRKKIIVSFMLIILVGTFGVTLKTPSVALGDPSPSRIEVWKLVNVTNPTASNKSTNINITVSPSRVGVNIACSTSITQYFENPDPGYADWFDWLNGTTQPPYHWGEMNWYVTAGSLTSITYDEIQEWFDMYSDSGAGVTYETFMDNNYMADWNSTADYNDPDIIYPPIAWEENRMILRYIPVSNGTTVNIAFKIVITEPGAYTFDVACTSPGLTISPSTWIVRGISTLLVPYDYSKIQDAINAASPGDMIVVDDGPYVEDLGIPSTKPGLEITPWVGASVTIKGVQNVDINDWPLALPNIEINASGVKIHGFTIEGPDYASGRYSSGMVIGASDVEIFNNTFKVTPAATLDEISQTIQTYHKLAIPGVDVSGLNIHDNRFINLSVGAAGYEGIYINLDEGNGSVTVRDNQFSGGIVRAITTERSETTISGNTITTDLAPNLPGSYQGINVGGVNDGNLSNVLVAYNIINGSDSGKGFMYGIKIGYSGTSTLTDVSVTGNTVGMNEVGVWTRYSAGGVKARFNNIDGNTLYGMMNTDSEAVDALYNWWGDERGPGNETGSTGDYVTINVNYGPWLVEPYEPGRLVPVTEVYVDPQLINRSSPALNTTFSVNVNVANVSSLYGFEFKLKWDPSLLNLTDISLTLPPQWLPPDYNYTILANGLVGPGNYSLGVSAYPPSIPFTGSRTLVSLTFKIIYEPIWPENVGSILALEEVKMVDSDANQIVILVHNGNYSCQSTKTELVLTPQEIAAYMVPTEFNVYVDVTVVYDLYASEFELTYNTSLLELIVEDGVDIGVPCTFAKWNLTEHDSIGTVFVEVKGISPPASGTITLATLPFKVIGFVWNTTRASANCTLGFISHQLLNSTLMEIQHDVINGTYTYTPLPGDLKMDGTVDILDVILAAIAFGSSPGDPNWDPRADLNGDNVVDILDIVRIVVNFGSRGP